MSWKRKFIIKLASLFKINLLKAAYEGQGISLPIEMDKNGEKRFIKRYLREFLANRPPEIVFDVGTNVGKFTEMVNEIYPDAIIHCFEPNPNLSKLLSRKFVQPNIYLNSIALGRKRKQGRLYVSSSNRETGHATVYENLFEKLHQISDVVAVDISETTLEEYCFHNGIQNIDLLKIDVEGHEIEVLRGCNSMLSKIKVIQFEFNEMNIFSRTFLRDFYELLPGFSFFRLKPSGLYPLGNYSTSYEIFKIQNIVAVKNV